MKRKILVVDDESSVRELFFTVFTEADYEVNTAEGAEQALKILQLENIDIIFLDLKLFGINGIELCRKIRETKPVSIIYAITGWSPLFEIEECREAGFDDYFEKPLDMDMLLKLVAEAFARIDRWKKRHNKLKA